jgi:predicted helicase
MNKEKGDAYEIYIRDYIISNLSKPCYLWKNTSDEVLIKAGIFHSNNEHRLQRKSKNLYGNCLMDTGVDLIQDNLNDTFTIVQCKNGYDKGIKMHDLQGLYMWLFNHSHLLGALYYTSKLHYHITENINPAQNRLEYYKIPFDNSTIQTQLDKISLAIQSDKLIDDYIITIQTKIKSENICNPILKPFDYQIQASKTILNHFNQGSSKAILSLPCGTGKTFTSWLIAESFSKVIIISPLKQFAKQNLDRYVEYGYSRSKTLLIDSDGTRNINKIEEFIKKDTWLLSCTYKSVDMLNWIYTRSDILVIIDEFHNLSKANVSNKSDPFYKVLSSTNKCLLMSATPRIYDLENNEELDNDSDSESENSYIDLGEIIYSMSFNTAIDKNYITDYRIYLPSVHETNQDLITDIDVELDLDIIDNELRAKCIYLYKCLVEKGLELLFCLFINIYK